MNHAVELVELVLVVVNDSVVLDFDDVPSVPSEVVLLSSDSARRVVFVISFHFWEVFTAILTWEDLWSPKCGTLLIIQLLGDLNKFGVVDGIGIPISGRRNIRRTRRIEEFHRTGSQKKSGEDASD